jgi:hypothetical protein
MIAVSFPGNADPVIAFNSGEADRPRAAVNGVIVSGRVSHEKVRSNVIQTDL